MMIAMRSASLALALVSLMHGIAQAQDVPRSYLCGDFVGSYFGAPSWKVHEDRATNQQVLLDFKGGGQPGSSIKWYRNGNVYYDSPGMGATMTSGFVIVTLTDNFIETYVFNAGTSELLFSMTRSGNPLLPNTVKALRGTCKPAGAMVR
jgi:hypothetical protein